MELNFEKQASDIRGAILFLKYGEKNLNIVQIKKGFARGGHYHTFETTHHILSGSVEYRETDIKTGKETIQTIKGPATIHVPPLAAHLLIGLEDALFVEAFDKDYSATIYEPYRSIVTQKMK